QSAHLQHPASRLQHHHDRSDHRTCPEQPSRSAAEQPRDSAGVCHRPADDPVADVFHFPFGAILKSRPAPFPCGRRRPDGLRLLPPLPPEKKIPPTRKKHFTFRTSSIIMLHVGRLGKESSRSHRE